MSLPRLSRPLLLTILVPVVSGVLMLGLVLLAFEASRSVAVEEHERKAEDLVELAASSVETLWVTPRNEAIQTLAQSETLARRLDGDVPFDALAQEWRIAESLLQGYFFIYYGLRDGTIEYYPDGELPEDYDPRERPWYQTGMSLEDGTAWTTPYEEAITGEMVVSTVAPLERAGERIGVISTDIQFQGLRAILESIELPPGGSVFLVDESGRPFIGTDASYVGREQLPPGNDKLFVASSAPISNGWRASIMVPQAALAESFAELLRPIMAASAVILLLGAGITSLLVGRIASRTYRLASYFREALDDSSPPREIFRTQDELSFLNKRFNQAMDEARASVERELAQERSFRFLIEQAPAGFFKSTKASELLYINPHCASMLGYSQDEAMRELTSVRELYYDRADRDRFLQDLLANGVVRNRKMRFVKRTGEVFWISMTASLREEAASSETGDPVIEGFLIDVTGDMEERNSLTQMAETDPLTGAANRRGFDTVAASVAEHAHTSGQRVALILFDIDRFKPINDTYGHDVGDRLLQELANLGRHNLRENDLFARFGGDEFAVLLPRTSEEAATQLARRLQESVRRMPVPEPLTKPPTLSLGIAVRAGAEVQIPELVKAADNAMYTAKQSGGDRIASGPSDQDACR
ncbi:MAG: diguanylate cyclase [Halorhodospira sp.]